MWENEYLHFRQFGEQLNNSKGRTEHLPNNKPFFPERSEFEKLAFPRQLISKGYAEDCGLILQYQNEKLAMIYLFKLFVSALYIGHREEIQYYMANLYYNYKDAILDIQYFTEKLWSSITYFQKAILYNYLVNDYNLAQIAGVLDTTPLVIHKKFLEIVECMDWDAKYDRLRSSFKKILREPVRDAQQELRMEVIE